MPRRPKKKKIRPATQEPEGVIEGDAMNAAAWRLALNTAAFYSPSLRIPQAMAAASANAAGEMAAQMAQKNLESAQQKTAAESEKKTTAKKKPAEKK